MTPTERTRPRRLMSLEPIDQFLATLMRLKVGLFVEDIAERFGMSNVNPVQTVSLEIHSLLCLPDWLYIQDMLVFFSLDMLD